MSKKERKKNRKENNSQTEISVTRLEYKQQTTITHHHLHAILATGINSLMH